MLLSSADLRAAETAARIDQIQKITALDSLDEISRALTIDWGADRFSDDEAQQIGEAINSRRASLKMQRVERAERGRALGLRRSLFPRKRRQIAPDRAEKLSRRRCVVLLGWLPAKLGALFTYGEVAALSVIAESAGEGGVCKASIGEIAARSGTSRSTVQNALRAAQLAGLLVKSERRVPGQKSLTNVVTIISREWSSWIARRGNSRREPKKSAIGSKTLNPMNQFAYREGASEKSQKRLKGISGRPYVSGFSGKFGRT